MNDTLYEQIATEITDLIERGTLRSGDRVMSLRAMSARRGVSIPTVLQAYRLLETRRVIESRPQSGFYVRSGSVTKQLERSGLAPNAVASEITTGDLIMRTLEMVTDPTLLPLGTALPDPALLPRAALARCLGRAARRSASQPMPPHMTPAGTLELRTQIARRIAIAGSVVEAADVVVTCGGAEALALCLRAVTQPGDTVAVESPTWFGTLQILEVLGLKALEVPVDPQDGISLDFLEAALESGSIRALVVTPACQNPQGTIMSVERKQELARLLTKHNVPAVEDDTYGELQFNGARPCTLHSLMHGKDVLLCGSFSKTLAPGYRLGWTIPGAYRDRVIHYKLATTVATAVPTQLAVADYLGRGGYESYLRRLRRTFQTTVERLLFEVSARLPAGTRVSKPQGGFLLWVELPDGCNTVDLQRRALARGLSVAPGPAFSASGRYSNCLRLNAGYQWSQRMSDSLDLLAELV